MKPLLETARPYIPLRVRIEEGWIDSCYGGSIKETRANDYPGNLFKGKEPSRQHCK